MEKTKVSAKLDKENTILNDKEKREKHIHELIAKKDWEALQKIDLTGTDLHGEDFTNADLHEKDFTDTNVSQANFTNANASFAKFIRTDANHADFTHTDVDYAQFRNTDVSFAKFIHANLSCAIFEDTDAHRAEFTAADISVTCFIRTDLGGAIFTDADASDADFTGSDVCVANFTNANISNADFTDVDASWANFAHAKLKDENHGNADFSRAILSRAVFDAGEEIRRGLILSEPMQGWMAMRRKGSFCELLIPKGAIVFSINNDICRTNIAKVVKGSGIPDDISNFHYKAGKTLHDENFCLLYNVEDDTGIQFFRTKAEAEEWWSYKNEE